MPTAPAADHLAVLVAQLSEALADERQARADERADAARARQFLERELAAAVRAAGIAERERQSLLELLIQQEERLLQRAAPAKPAWRDRLRDAAATLRAWPTRFGRSQAASAADPAAVPRSRRGPALLACVIGLDQAALAVVLANLRAHAAEAEARPVILTDSLQFDLLRRSGIAFEYLPSRSDVAPALEGDGWRLYVARRLALLVEKWQAAAILAYGEGASRWLAELAAEPLLPPPVRALLPDAPGPAP